MKSPLYGKNELKLFKLLIINIEYDPNFKENFLFRNKHEKLENMLLLLFSKNFF